MTKKTNNRKKEETKRIPFIKKISVLMPAVRTRCWVCSIDAGTFPLCPQWAWLLLQSCVVGHLGLTVGFNAVNHCEESLQREKVGGVELPRHWERILVTLKKKRFNKMLKTMSMSEFQRENSQTVKTITTRIRERKIIMSVLKVKLEL